MIMNAFALAADNAAELTFAERATTAGIVSLQGMVTIFLVLTILWGAIELLHAVLAGKKEKPAEKTASVSAPATQAPNDDAAVAAAIAAAMAASDDSAVVAAITAAISEQLASEGYTGSFRVVSFKRVGVTKRRRV